MKISESCYAVAGLACVPPWSVNAGFITGSEKTLIIDTGNNLLAAQTIYGYATTARLQNKLIVINTEQHIDHISGNAFFKDKGIEIYGHYKIKRDEADLEANVAEYNACIPNIVRREHNEGQIFFGNNRIVNPDKPLFEETKLALGNFEAQIFFTPGHTPSNISVYLPDEKVLFCGDCLVTDYLPNLEGGARQDWQIWLDSIGKIEDLSPRVIVPGHGEVLQGDKLEAEVKRTRTILQEAIRTGLAPTSPQR
jgi:glyoxylase-like metal-dependent hydrolase (beta-lactamase superfamily II)